ncbi:hypothetical protein Tco_0800428 [Tanacetum coccineum]|uniref:Uncharacterized protein n=1 Tax=Tanacetum coccineum TaxID=301880 RepID=A0ABQ4ZWU9_9ASTR
MIKMTITIQLLFMKMLMLTEDVVLMNLERKSDETEEVLIEEEKDASDVKSGDTEELDLERIQSTARQSTVTPRTLNFEDEAGLSIPGPMQSQPQQPTQATDPKEKGKGILVEEPKKKKLTLQQIRALETTNDEEVARKVQAEWDAEEERKRLEALKKPKTISKKPTSLAQERTQMMNFLKGQGYKNLQKLRKGSEDGLRKRDAKDFESVHKIESHGKAISMITVFKGHDSHRWRQDLHHLYLVVQDYYKHIPPTELGLILLGVHTLELEDGTMIHMLTERRYPLSRELMIRMLDHGMEVEDESDIAITLDTSVILMGQTMMVMFLKQLLASPEQTATVACFLVQPWIIVPISRLIEEQSLMQRQRIFEEVFCSKQEVSFQILKQDCIQDTAQRIILDVDSYRDILVILLGPRYTQNVQLSRKNPLSHSLKSSDVEFKSHGED